MPSPLRSAALFTLTSALLLGLLSPGCSQQGEGERCSNLQAGDSDCESGLVCVPKARLLERVTDRCCKPDGSYDDSRCTPNTGSGNTAGTAGSSAMSEGGAPDSGGAPASAGAPGGGAPMEEPIDQAGAPSSAGMPAMSSDGGTPSGGMTSTPAGGQGGAG